MAIDKLLLEETSYDRLKLETTGDQLLNLDETGTDDGPDTQTFSMGS